MSSTPSNLPVSTLETAVRRLIQEEDTTNSNFATAEIYDYLNEGCRRLATRLEWQLAVFTAQTVAEQSTYSIPDHTIELVDIYLNSKPLVLVDRADLPNLNSDWLSQASGEPKFAYRADRNRIGLYPKPSSTYASLELRMQGVKLPDTMVSATDTADVHISLQDCLPYFAAFKCELKGGNNQRAADFLKLFNNFITETQAQLDKFADSLMAFHFDGRYFPDEPRTLQ